MATTFTYAGTLATNLDLVRFLIGDTVAGISNCRKQFWDQEITQLLSETTNDVWETCGKAFQVLSQDDDRSMGLFDSVSHSFPLKQLKDLYKARADLYRKIGLALKLTAGTGAGLTYNADMATWNDLNKLRFRTGDTDSSYGLFIDSEMTGLLNAVDDDLDDAVGVIFLVLGADADRLITLRNACSGAVPLLALMEDYALRASGYLV